jgi:DNA-binding NarL/FixJ family response regulator
MAASPERHDAATPASRRVGIVATDPLRILGLQTILGVEAPGHQPALVVELAALDLLDTVGLEVVFIDSGAVPHLFELLGTFKRARPELRLIVLGPEASLEHIKHIIGAGAKGYLPYLATEAELRMAFAVVEDGSIWAPRKVMACLLAVPAEPPRKLELTPRETQVLTLLVTGRSNREIATALDIDETTVKAHMSRLMRKAGVKNRTALTLHALQRGNLENEGRGAPLTRK